VGQPTCHEFLHAWGNAALADTKQDQTHSRRSDA
jgi:hypothetical protein